MSSKAVLALDFSMVEKSRFRNGYGTAAANSADAKLTGARWIQALNSVASLMKGRRLRRRRRY